MPNFQEPKETAINAKVQVLEKDMYKVGLNLESNAKAIEQLTTGVTQINTTLSRLSGFIEELKNLRQHIVVVDKEHKETREEYAEAMKRSDEFTNKLKGGLVVFSIVAGVIQGLIGYWLVETATQMKGLTVAIKQLEIENAVNKAVRNNISSPTVNTIIQPPSESSKLLSE